MARNVQSKPAPVAQASSLPAAIPARMAGLPEAALPHSVTLKRNHPTGIYRRAGLTFNRDTPTIIEGDLPEAVANDPWLVITEMPA